MTSPTPPQPAGASAAAIQAHYDVGDDFYRLWLDPSMTYSAALWDGPDDTRDLAWAQRNKVEFHLRNAGAPPARRLLDIGCGWGTLLRRAVELGCESAVGLTLSAAQAAHVARLDVPGMEARLENWQDHVPAAGYEAIVSVGAFEHFTKPTDDSARKIEIYRGFFARCREWLPKSGRMSLQTIAYGTLRRDDPNVGLMSQIFPDSDLPRLEEIVLAAEGLFEIARLRNDRVDYARTCETWANNLRARRAEATTLVGREQVARYERYLKLSSYGFWTGNLGLLRLRLVAI
ncbi:MAG: class I SAM-dependent methyltransferase [Rhodospirillales bacterium]|nr:class I SAM-dependent methyltransferase [Rhodospirillales bacterium]